MRNILSCTSGVVAAEFAMVISAVGLAAIVGAQHVAPAAHAWVDRAYVAVVEADARLDALCAVLRTIDDADVSMCPAEPEA